MIVKCRRKFSMRCLAIKKLKTFQVKLYHLSVLLIFVLYTFCSMQGQVKILCALEKVMRARYDKISYQ